jgi:hypothetical protein
MMIVLLSAGIGVVAAGLLAIGFGIEVKEFSLGSTLILAGTVGVCTGLIMLSLVALVRELRTIAGRLGPADQAVPARARTEPPPSIFADPEPAEGAFSDGPLFLRDQPARENAGAGDAASAAPWQEGATRGRPRQRGNPPAAAEAAPETKPRRNLLFSSSPRKERDRAAGDDDLNSVIPVARPPAASVRSPEAAPPTSFEDAWPPSEPTRAAPAFRRSARAPSTFNDTNAGAPARADDRAQVTVLKSGVVDGMAYSLYSDGSIEAQMPEGMMRFASISELRAHLDQRL